VTDEPEATEPPEQPAAEPPPGPSAPKPPHRRVLDYAGRSWRLIAGAVGTIATIVGLVFVFFPEAKPAAKESCKAQGVVLSNVRATDKVPYRVYLDREEASTEGLSPKRLNQPGQLISFDADTKGFVGKTLVVTTRVVGSDLGPVDELGLERRHAQELIPESCEDQSHAEVWSPLPSAPGRYRVELRILDPRGHELRVAETQPFST
jgi:hypothetical protein